MKTIRASIYGISQSELANILKNKFEERNLPINLSKFDNFSVLIVEKFHLTVKGDLVGVIIIREIDDKKIDVKIVICGTEYYVIVPAEKSMSKFLLKILTNICKERNLDLSIKEA